MLCSVVKHLTGKKEVKVVSACYVETSLFQRRLTVALAKTSIWLLLFFSGELRSIKSKGETANRQ